MIWPVALGLSSVVVFLATLTSFDRKLGRAEGPSLRLLHGDFTRRERAIKATFIAMALLGTSAAMFSARQSGLPDVVNATQVSVGLFIAASSAALSAVRQLGGGAGVPRARFGRSSWLLVLANWAGPYRLVSLVALLATLAVLGHWDSRTDPNQSIWLIPIYILSVGAASCSLGVAAGNLVFAAIRASAHGHDLRFVSHRRANHGRVVVRTRPRENRLDIKPDGGCWCAHSRRHQRAIDRVRRLRGTAAHDRPSRVRHGNSSGRGDRYARASFRPRARRRGAPVARHGNLTPVSHRRFAPIQALVARIAGLCNL